MEDNDTLKQVLDYQEQRAVIYENLSNHVKTFEQEMNSTNFDEEVHQIQDQFKMIG